jgi:CheY-like chemotaxis protein
MIEQVIMNLALNARDAMPAGGKLAIAIESLQVEPDRVAAKPDVRPGQFLCLSVSDSGCGMDAATRDRIFEPFFTTKELGKGTGLGLATVHGIVAQHKGWLEVESEVGKGATFKVFLPASAKKLTGSMPEPMTVSMRGHETILLVEDEVALRRSVALNLGKLGYAVFEAENGQAAMNLWLQRRGEIDLLFSDMVMPEGLTGLDLAEKLKKAKPNLKVIISSGYSAEIVGPSRLDAQGIIYLQKPYRVETLAKAVRDCLDA